MSASGFSVLFVSRHNTARSLMAEGLLRKWGQSRFAVQSAGPEPAESMHPVARDLLEKIHVDTGVLVPKHWSAALSAEKPLDFVFVCCDWCWNQPMPDWPGRPLVGRWPFPDPLSLEGSDLEKRALFNLVFGMIERRVKLVCALPDNRLARLTAGDLSSMGMVGEHASA